MIDGIVDTGNHVMHALVKNVHAMYDSYHELFIH